MRTPDGQNLAPEFAEKVAAWNFDSAFEMLHDTLKGELSPGKIKKIYRGMVKSKDITATSIIFENALDDWPEKTASELKLNSAFVVG